MSTALIYEEINRINFLMNYDSSKLITEQQSYDTHHITLLEAPPAKPGTNPPAKLTPQQIQSAKQKIQQQATKSANSIFQELMKAFDMDGDRVLTDYDGTNEGLAVAAIKKIKNKETLDALNKRIAATKQYKNLKSWLNAEMSDFDSEYGQIWSKLEKMGYAGANYNILLKVAGYTPVGMLVKGADKAIDTLRGMSMEDIMEGFRSLLSGIGGTVATTILAVTGPIGAGINALLYAILTVWDVILLKKGSPKFSWFNFILDIFSTVLAGFGVSKAFKPAEEVLKQERTLEGFVKTLSDKFPTLAEWTKKIAGFLGTAVSKISGFVAQGIEWVVGKLPFLSKLLEPLKNMASTAVEYGKMIAQKFAASNVVQKVAQVGGQALSYLKNFGTLALDKVMVALESKLGAKLAEKFDQKIFDKIKNYSMSTAKGYSVGQIRPMFCKVENSADCKTFDTALHTAESLGVLVTIGKEGREALDKGVESLKNKDAKGYVETGKKGTEFVEKGAEFFSDSENVAALKRSQNVGKSVVSGAKRAAVARS